MTVVPDFDPLADANLGRGGVERNRYDQAMLIPLGGKPGDKLVPFTSISSLANYLNDKTAIHMWEMKYLARGMAMSPDLVRLAAVEGYTTGFDMEDEGKNRESGRALQDIVTRALDRARLHERADWGTAVHRATEPGQKDAPGFTLPEEMQRDVEAWWKAMRGIKIVATEIFVVNDRLRAAGTFDHLAIIPDHEGLVPIDKKTGRLKLGVTEVQVATYADSKVYDKETGERISFEDAFGLPVNREIGYKAHIEAQEAVCPLLPLNLVRGLAAAERAAWARDWRSEVGKLDRKKGMPAALDTDKIASDHAMTLVRAAKSKEELLAIYAEYDDVWSLAHTAAGQELIGLWS